jgi:hypothetical protein
MLFRFTVIVILIYCSQIFSGPAVFAQNAPVTSAAFVGNAAPGSISVPLTVTGFTDIGAISLAIDYDYSVMHFTGSTANPLLPSFPAGELDLGTGFHRITMGWFGNGTSLDDGTTIITLHFNYFSGITSLNWYDNGPSCEYADGNINVLNDIPTSTYYINGSVCGPVGDPGPVTGDTEVCAGQGSVNYNVEPIPNATGYMWDLQDGAVIISGENTNAILVDFGNMAVSGDISVHGINACGEGPLSELTVMVNPLPIANAGNDTTINYGTSTTLHAADGEYEVYSYHWSPEELLLDPNAQDPQTVILTETSIFTVMVTNQATFCQRSDQVIVTITGGPLTINPVAVPSYTCQGDPAQLYSNAGGGSGNYTYLWTSTPPGNPPWSSTLANPLVTPDATVIYHVIVNDGVTSVNDTVALLVSALPTATIYGGDTLCGEDSFTTLQVDLSGTPPWNFSYTYGNTTTFVANQQESPYFIIASEPGDYFISALEDANCTGSSYGTAIVRKFPVPATPEINVNVFELISSSCCGNQWYRNGNAIPGATGQTYQVTVNGLYFVIVTLNGCSSEPSDTVDIIVGISESRQDCPAIYPNPADKNVSIKISPDLNDISIISIYSTTGILLAEKINLTEEKNINLDTGMLLPGIYLLVFKGDNSIFTTKLIIR